MSKSKTTKRALFTSVVAIFMCVTMLIGTTFAWFTDTASSGVNKIQAGNLDIELEYFKNGTWKTVEGKTDLFSDVTLWEPGATSVVYLRIRNLGTLALKYQLSMNIYKETTVTNVNGDTFKLSQYLKYGVVEGQNTAFASRDDARTAAEGVAHDLSEYTKTGNMVGKDATGYADQYIALVVYMPETVGNEANYRGSVIPKIDLGIKLVATQDTVEEDSFDELYDENATYPVIPDPISVTSSGNISVAAGGTWGTTNIGDAQIVVPANAVSADTNAVFSMELSERNTDSVTYEISLKEEQSGDSITLSAPAKVTAVIGNGLINVEVKHSGAPMTKVTSTSRLTDGTYYYNKTTGKLTICTSSFSPFEIKFEYDGEAALDGVVYRYLEDALEAAVDGDTVVMLKDVSTWGTTINKDITLDLQGYNLKGFMTAVTVYVESGSAATIKNGTISMPDTGNRAGVYLIDGDNNLTLQNVIINSKSFGVWSNSGGNTVTIKNCGISSKNSAVYQNGSYGGNTFNIYNTTITDTSSVGIYISNSVNNAKQNLTIDGCTISGPSGVEIKHTNATITNSTLIGTATHTGSGANGNGSCTTGYAFAATTNGLNDKYTGTVSVSNCKVYNGTTTEGESNGYVFVYQVADGSSVTIDGTAVTDYNTYGGEVSEGRSEG